MQRPSISRSTPKRPTLVKFENKAARGKKDFCEICQVKFSIMTREHQCKRCKRAVCDKCATYKQFVIENGKKSEKQHRLCTVCKREQDVIFKIADENNLQFCNDSAIALKWLENIRGSPNAIKSI